MKIKSISGLILLVKDFDQTADFYEKLGFRFGKRQEDRLTAYINWFWVDFVKVGSFKATGNDSQFIYLAVEDVDETYKDLKAKKLNPTMPENFNSGRRETMISDPDGYKLVFFTKK